MTACSHSAPSTRTFVLLQLILFQVQVGPAFADGFAGECFGHLSEEVVDTDVSLGANFEVTQAETASIFFSILTAHLARLKIDLVSYESEHYVRGCLLVQFSYPGLTLLKRLQVRDVEDNQSGCRIPNQRESKLLNS